jgi:glycosyltransferase involved in cell wall biosynthesis
VFPSLREKPIRVLYPALQSGKCETESKQQSHNPPIVSLNRYERKKNIELLLQAYALLKAKTKKTLPPLIIAGGYDVNNVENVEYMGELQSLARELELHVTFQRSISEQERLSLLRDALCVVYTPHLEHFGIVPLETMAAGTPVVAVNSGGPKETVVDGVTGILCDNTPESFCDALSKFVSNPALARRMGAAGRDHVLAKFGPERFQQEWLRLVNETLMRGQERRGTQTYVVYQAFVYVLEGILALMAVLMLTWFLRQMRVLEQDAHIVGSIKRALIREDL